MNLIHFILCCLLLVKSLEINSFLIRKDSTESLWASDKGNSQNTYRIEPSLPGNYSHLNWKFEYNVTSQDNTPFGLAAGLNGDLYFFIGQSRSHAGKRNYSFHDHCERALITVETNILMINIIIMIMIILKI